MLFQILIARIFNIPVLVVFAIGVVLASRRMERYPRPSLLTWRASVVLLVGSLISEIIMILFQYRSINRPEGETSGDFFHSYGWMATLAALIRIISLVVGMSLLMSAVYADREGRGQPSPELSPEERLATLKTRLDRGLITEREYNAARQSILDSL
jgi:uncharacterized membrane protein